MALTEKEKDVLDQVGLKGIGERLQEELIAAASIETADLVDGSVTTVKLGADAVDNSKLADNAVSLENLDTGITPSDIAIDARQHTTVGGAATEVVSISGVVATDIVLATLHTEGTTPRTIVNVFAGTDDVSIVFSDDPSTDHVVNLVVLRAAA